MALTPPGGEAKLSNESLAAQVQLTCVYALDIPFR
jgi:hypothetical protein